LGDAYIYTKSVGSKALDKVEGFLSGSFFVGVVLFSEVLIDLPV
jgi:hypothetical protein